MNDSLKAVIIGFLLGVISYLLSAVRLNFIQAAIISIILAIIFACVSYITIDDQKEGY